MAKDFATWMAQVDMHMQQAIGFTHEDMPDQTWYDWFEDEVNPEDAAAMCIENEWGAEGLAVAGMESAF